MTVLRKVRSCPKPVVVFESNLESVKSYKCYNFAQKNIKVAIAQTINKSV